MRGVTKARPVGSHFCFHGLSDQPESEHHCNAHPLHKPETRKLTTVVVLFTCQSRSAGHERVSIRENLFGAGRQRGRPEQLWKGTRSANSGMIQTRRLSFRDV